MRGCAEVGGSQLSSIGQPESTSVLRVSLTNLPLAHLERLIHAQHHLELLLGPDERDWLGLGLGLEGDLGLSVCEPQASEKRTEIPGLNAWARPHAEHMQGPALTFFGPRPVALAAMNPSANPAATLSTSPATTTGPGMDS